jgi:hypothetical protein
MKFELNEMAIFDKNIVKLNNLLNDIGGTGFKFVDGMLFKSRIISISVPHKYNIGSSVEFGSWLSIDEMFNYSDEIYRLIDGIDLYRADKNYMGKYLNSYMLADFSNLNDAGYDFLKCITNSKSLDEFKLRLQLMGYDV